MKEYSQTFSIGAPCSLQRENEDKDLTQVDRHAIFVVHLPEKSMIVEFMKRPLSLWACTENNMTAPQI